MGGCPGKEHCPAPSAPSAQELTGPEEQYKPFRLYPALFQGSIHDEWLTDTARQLQAHKKVHLPAQVWSEAPDGSQLREEAWEVYSFQCFTKHFLQILNEELSNFYQQAAAHGIEYRRPNSMNNYGVILNEIGMKPLLDALQQGVIWPLARALFPQPGFQFDSHHSFIVRYRSGEDLGLDMHVDDSDVTFNVCLGSVFTGATLSFCGNNGASNHRELSHTYQHEVGRAVVHLGNRRHGADDIESGERLNLIIWSHNNQWRGSREYQHMRSLYQQEQRAPDAVCLSYTHDRDFEAYREVTSQERQRRNNVTPWCPPKGKEYPGFPI